MQVLIVFYFIVFCISISLNTTIFMTSSRPLRKMDRYNHTSIFFWINIYYLLSVSSTIYISVIYLSIYLSIYLCMIIHLSIYLSIYLSLCHHLSTSYTNNICPRSHRISTIDTSNTIIIEDCR